MSGVRRWAVFQTLALLQLLTLVAGQQSYVVYMGRPPAGDISTAAHHEKLASVLGSRDAAGESLIYSYKNFNSFACKLSSEQAATLRSHEDIVSVFPNKAHSLHTTHSWAFLGLEDYSGNAGANSLWTKSNYGKDVVIGLLDTGAWPESASFDDSGLGPIPANWKGECTHGDDFGPLNCNKKLIGGRFYIKGFEAQEGPLNTTATGSFLSARDSDGHGTHTSSTAGGSFAPNANCLGFASGVAKGGAPLARIAVYKVCWTSLQGSGGCYDADILAAFDQGISDGVDVFSVSLGSNAPLLNLFQDGIAIGSFHASQRNISVVASAGNAGPEPGTVGNVAPWITTVAAGNIDRNFSSVAVFGANLTISGQSLSTEKLQDKFYPLVSSADIYRNDSISASSQLCLAGSLDPAKARGKIVVCVRGVTSRVDKGQQVKAAGGIGLILVNDISSGSSLTSDPHVLPATHITYDDGLKVFAYINSTSSPVARLSPALTFIGTSPAPVLAAFSSQGPNKLIPDLLKPDITGPGLNVLAAFTAMRSVSGLPGDTRTVNFTILSGTSMACPHVAGTTASLKAYHPTWTPAALHSALLTTGTVTDNKNQLILESSLNTSNPFGTGSGYLNPNGAAEPGLVYDNQPTDYLKFLCSLGYTKAEIAAIRGTEYTCLKSYTVSNFNYPTLSVSQLGSNLTVKRTVTNVGLPNSIYTASVPVSPPGIQVSISPKSLKFSALGQKKSFHVTLTKINSTNGRYSFGSYLWWDGTHSVRSAIAIKTSQ